MEARDWKWWQRVVAALVLVPVVLVPWAVLLVLVIVVSPALLLGAPLMHWQGPVQYAIGEATCEYILSGTRSDLGRPRRNRPEL